MIVEAIAGMTHLIAGAVCIRSRGHNPKMVTRTLAILVIGDGGVMLLSLLPHTYGTVVTIEVVVIALAAVAAALCFRALHFVPNRVESGSIGSSHNRAIDQHLSDAEDALDRMRTRFLSAPPPPP